MPAKNPKPKKLSKKEIENYIDGIYNGSITEKNLPLNVYQSIAQYLEHAVYEGYGMQIEYAAGRDLDLLNKLRENVYMFSAAKTYQQTKEISSLLIGENGKLRTSKEFNELAKKTYENWNDNYGETEYSTAIGQAYAAQKWGYIESQKKVLPNLRYKAISDPCDICAPLNDMVAPADDPIWNSIAPLNHFNCKCILVQEDDEVELTDKDKVDDLFQNAVSLMQPLFKSNPGKDGMIFNESHPYWDVPKKDQEYAENNFDLPLPEPVEEPKIRKYEEALRIMQNYKVPEEREQALQSYTGSWYMNINNYLRKGVVSQDAYTVNRVEKTIPALQDFLQQAPKCQFTTYRGLAFKEEEFEAFEKECKEGAVIVDKGFMSTTVSKDVINTFMSESRDSVVIEVDGKSGVLIQPWGVQREKEILFNRGTKFKVISAKTKTEEVQWSGGETRKILYLQIQEL